jgi:hypothetical protein
MANILLDKSHKPLLKAAICLGDWLLSLDTLSEDDKQAVRAVQKALDKLPKLNDGTLAMYGFSLEEGDEINGLVRGWDVSLEYFANDAERQGGLELFSSYIPIPETTAPDVLALKKQNEVYFNWPVGDICNLVKPEQATQWIAAVADPNALRQTGQRLRIEIVFGGYYGEVELN